MRKRHFALLCSILAAAATLTAQPRTATEKPGPRKSGFYDFWRADGEFGPGLGSMPSAPCTVTVQPSIYSGNFLIDCDGEVPHNETTIAVHPLNPRHAVGGYHSYRLSFLGATAIARVIGAVSVTRDGGTTWQEIYPPIAPYQFSGDPALAFDGDGRLYFANIADHEGPGGSYTGPSVIVARSDDGGVTWSNPVTVAKGQGAETRGSTSKIFQDKEFIAADQGVASPFRNRAYVTWTSFQEGRNFLRAPITLSSSDNGETWTAGREVSGFSPFCVATISGKPNECDLNQFSIPAVAPNGRVYVAFENFNTPAENQYMVVNSGDGGRTWSAPSRVDTIYDINFPLSATRDETLTGCQFRIAAPGNLAVDPSDPTGRTLYVAWADNRNGTAAQTNTDVLLARSTDGGSTWNVHVVDSAPNDQFYAWVAVAGDGRVDVGYMDRSYSSGQNVCQYGFSLTRLTFAANGTFSKTKQRVDSGLSDPGHSRWFSSAGNSNSRFIGDYNGIAIGSDGSTYSLWTDQRNVVANPPSPARNHGQHAVGQRQP